MDPEEEGEVAEGEPVNDESGDVSIEEAVAALGRRGDEPVRLGRGGHRQARNNDGVTDDETGGEAEGVGPEAVGEEDEADDDGNEPDDEGDANKTENTRAKYKRQRDEARQSAESLRARDAQWSDHAAKLENAYGKVQSDYDDLQADFDEIAEYVKELETELREAAGWEPDPNKVKLRELSRENRKLKRSQEREKQQAAQTIERQTLAERTAEAHKIADQTRGIAKKYKVDVQQLAAAAATILATKQLPDLEAIAKTLAMHGKVAQDARSKREVGTQAPRRATPRRAPRPSSHEDIDGDAVSFMKEKFEREGRVFPR